MPSDRQSDFDTAATGGFASLMDIPMRRKRDGGEKKSDITEALASIRVPPQYITPDEPVVQDDPLTPDIPVTPESMRDVTPPARGDIVSFWDALRASRPMPDFNAVRPSEIAARWPHLILFRCESSDDLRPDTAFATALRAHRRGANGCNPLDGGVETTAMVSQWILSNAKDAAATAAPVRDRFGFETTAGHLLYDLVAVPFGNGAVDRVLCSIETCAT